MNDEELNESIFIDSGVRHRRTGILLLLFLLLVVRLVFLLEDVGVDGPAPGVAGLQPALPPLLALLVSPLHPSVLEPNFHLKFVFFHLILEKGNHRPEHQLARD